MAAITRLGLDGYGVRRTGSFAGKEVSVHPVGTITRLSLDGYGAKRSGSFAGKTASSGAGPHPVGVITRLALDGYGARRISSFAGKEASGAVSTTRERLVGLMHGVGKIGRPW